MEEYQRWALPRLPVGDGLPVDLYRTQLSPSHCFRLKTPALTLRSH